MVNILEVFVLLVIFQIKHFISDYPLQNSFMLGKFKQYPDYIQPLCAHAGVHAFFTFCISLVYGFSTIPLIVILALSTGDFIIHFIVDRIKASPNLLGKYKVLDGMRIQVLNEARADYMRMFNKFKKQESLNELHRIDEQFKGNRYFWIALGWDAMMHHLTHYLIIFILLISKL